MNQEPMPGRREREWCPTCHGPSGPDCPTRYRSRRTTRRQQRIEIRREWEREQQRLSGGAA